MGRKYYIDTSIWIDLYENRVGYTGAPLGYFAGEFFSRILANKDNIIISDILIKELEKRYSIAQINGMMKLFEHIIIKYIATVEQRQEAKELAYLRDVPFGDALHAIISRDNDLTLITRDNDFRRLIDITPYHKPEEII